MKLSPATKIKRLRTRVCKALAECGLDWRLKSWLESIIAECDLRRPSDADYRRMLSHFRMYTGNPFVNL